MPMDSIEVNRIAHLARISVPEEEAQRTALQLESILQLVESLRAVPTEGVETMAHPLDLQQPLREDTVCPEEGREWLMASAPAAAEGLFLVPRVIE